MGFLSKLYESVRVNSTLVDHPNNNEVYNASSQTIGSGAESANVSSISNAGDITDSGNNNTIYDQSTQTIGSGNETVTADQADVTGETYVVGNRTSDSSSQTSGTWTNILNNEVTDVRNELDSNFRFSPDTTGDYRVIFSVRFDGGSAGDYYLARILNQTDTSTVYVCENDDGGGNDMTTFSWSGELLSSKSYEFQAQNNSSSFTLSSANNGCRVTIVKELAHS